LTGFRGLVSACLELGMPDGYARFVNVNHTLRALYFVLRRDESQLGSEVSIGVEGMLTEFSRL
jgi:hypothetical protein